MPEESYVWTGDENLIDVNLVVHYRVADPASALFKWVSPTRPRHARAGRRRRGVGRPVGCAGAGGKRVGFPRGDGPARGRRPAGRNRGRKSPRPSCRRANEALDRCHVGLRVEQVCFGDIHPPLEVVPAFRDVSIAMEEKESRINEAQAYQYQTAAAARGQAAERMAAAAGFAADRTQRATGAAARFLEVAAAYAAAPKVTALRLYLQTMETRWPANEK